MSIFYKFQWAWEGVKLTQKSLEFFYKKSADKIWSKEDRVESALPNAN